MKSLRTYVSEALEGSRMKYNGKNNEFVDVILENTHGVILILRRANYMKNFRTCWGVVGGAIDARDSSPVDAAVRETREETGIIINEAVQMQLKELFTFEHDNGNKTHVFYIKLDNDPDVQISREHSKYEWIDFRNEKINERKWMPDMFKILQKWESEYITEKLIINNNLIKTNLDTNIKKYIDWKETDDYPRKMRINEFLVYKLKSVLYYHSLLLDDNDIANIANKSEKYINKTIKTPQVFKCGDLINSESKSINNLLDNINDYEKKYIHQEEDIDGVMFEVYYVLGDEYMLLSFGSVNIRYVIISHRPKNIIEKLVINKDLKLFDINDNVKKVFDAFKNMTYKNSGDNKFYILQGMTTMLSLFSSKTLNDNERSEMEKCIKTSFNNEILKIADNCKEYTWWDQDDEDLDDELYGKMTEIEKYGNVCDLHDKMTINVPDRKGFMKIDIKGYVNDDWLVFLLNDCTNDYLRGFIICRL